MRRHTIGGPLRDARGARGRSRAVREALRADPSGAAAEAVMRAGLGGDWRNCRCGTARSGDLARLGRQLDR